MTGTAYERADAWATHWAQRWYLDEYGEDLLRLSCGVSAGWATHVEAYFVLFDLALQALGEMRQRSSRLDRLKAMGWDRAMRAWGMRALRAKEARGRATGMVAFVVEYPTPSMTLPIKMVARNVPDEHRTIWTSDPRVLLGFSRSGLACLALTVPVPEQWRMLKDAAQEVAALLAQALDRPVAMPLGKHEMRPRAAAVLEGAMRRSMPWLAIESLALQRAIEHTRPSAIAIGSDQHRVGRLVVHAASTRGMPVTVLQHGLPQAPIGYLPVVADRVAVWSEEAKSWFEDRGTDPSRLEVLGNPRMDDLVVSRGRRIRLVSPGAIRLVLALSPTARSTNERLVSISLETLERLTTAELVVKLHPGHRDWSFVRDQVARSHSRNRARIAHRDDINALLRWADVTLVHRSTVALESLVAGTPVVVVNSDLPSVADVELRHLDLPSAHDAAELVSTVVRLCDPDERLVWFTRRDRAIERAAGPLDGRSAERIAAVLLAGSRPS